MPVAGFSDASGEASYITGSEIAVEEGVRRGVTRS
jgi:hypothetical protein